MAKVHLVTDVEVLPARGEVEGPIPIRLLSGTVFLRIHAPTTDELDLPWEGQSLALHPDLAKKLAHDLLSAVQELENDH